jgi:hypothetical protein|tara:strand:+ start:1302 stop:1454 length:153 start_codon:yes stop_codon:yes gene_type:complete
MQERSKPLIDSYLVLNNVRTIKSSNLNIVAGMKSFSDLYIKAYLDKNMFL